VVVYDADPPKVVELEFNVIVCPQQIPIKKVKKNVPKQRILKLLYCLVNGDFWEKKIVSMNIKILLAKFGLFLRV
jgi:hypothetical protein